MNVSTHLEEAERAARTAEIHLASAAEHAHNAEAKALALDFKFAADEIKQLRAYLMPDDTTLLEQSLGAPAGEVCS